MLVTVVMIKLLLFSKLLGLLVNFFINKGRGT